MEPPPPLTEGGDADATFPPGSTAALDLPEMTTTASATQVGDAEGGVVQMAIVDAAPVDQEELV